VPLVHHGIAVFVDSVAEFRSARVNRCRAIVTIPRAGGEAVPILVEVLVRIAVAVVVDAIAGFGGRGARRAGLGDAADAVADGALAGADST
jgi:hypothetical protein